jgi:hypothetical protein
MPVAGYGRSAEVLIAVSIGFGPKSGGMGGASMSRRIFGLLAVCGLLIAGVPVTAHHSLAGVFEMTKELAMTGTLKKIEFVSPHSMVHLDVKNPDGSTTTWTFLTGHNSQLVKLGLVRSGPNALKAGDTISIKGFAARNGKAYGFLKTIVLPDKRELTVWLGDPNG